ncbi:alpha/beta hydrolase [Saccharopolyspora spinosa]|uniref:Alpha/beta hydrolase family protein n=1 Tax=Saccharopolyspora spinosa TaxID=60894 RepID=A0A2N3XV94_SACSN|nr:alpha/beta fold hydrolase [Saccharopolyspora spinosa]PKW14592.1 alpha/beta hydrolase family protein [Saccharopolyspora spinosa]
MSRASGTTTVLLVLHGGKAVSRSPVRPTQLTYRRMLPFARTAHRATARLGAAVWVLRNRTQGWNEPMLDPVADARWALGIIRATHPNARVALIGHSMGARVALRLASEPDVTAVCALAPWTIGSEPVKHLPGRRVWIVHGDRDRITPAESSLVYARRARESGAEITRHVVAGSGHAMLRRAGQWHRHVRRFALTCAAERSPA